MVQASRHRRTGRESGGRDARTPNGTAPAHRTYTSGTISPLTPAGRPAGAASETKPGSTADSPLSQKKKAHKKRRGHRLLLLFPLLSHIPILPRPHPTLAIAPLRSHLNSPFPPLEVAAGSTPLHRAARCRPRPCDPRPQSPPLPHPQRPRETAIRGGRAGSPGRGNKDSVAGMGQEGMGYNNGKGGGGGGLPMTAPRPRGASPLGSHHHSRSRKIHRTFNNLKITVLCGLVTILVLRGTIGLNLSLPSQPSDAEALAGAKAVEDIDRILREIRSDSGPDPDDEGGEFSASSGFNASALSADEAAAAYAAAAGKYALGPKISDWDARRRQWLAENPGFPATVAGGKPRIMLVTGSQPGPCDNPLGDHYLLKSTKNKMDYCRIHGIEVVHNLAHLDTELAGYWAKLPLLRRLMLSHPEVEWIWWMDSDALFTDMAFELPLSRYDGHNLIIHGYQDLLFEKHSWIALNTGSFLLRNCQWSLDLLDAWAPMGPKGFIRDQAGKVLTANLKGRPAFEADDQSALIYLLLSQKEKWMDKVFIENSYYLHGFWAGLVDKYEEMMENHHPGLGDERWPFVTHFVGCKPCGSYGDYPVERCLGSMERAFNFADNQVLRLYGFKHKGLESPKIKRIRDQTTKPINDVENLDMKAKISTAS